MNDIQKILRCLVSQLTFGFLNRKLTCHCMDNKKVAYGKLKLVNYNLCLAGKLQAFNAPKQEILLNSKLEFDSKQ